MRFWCWIVGCAVAVYVAFEIHAAREPEFWKKPWKRGWRIEK